MLMALAGVGASTNDLQEILATVPLKQGKVFGVANLDLESLSQERRNELAVAAAKALVKKKVLWDSKSMIRVRATQGYLEADLLHALFKTGGISAPEAIPYLIERMKHADNEPPINNPNLMSNNLTGKEYQYDWSTSKICLEVLAGLTKHHSGYPFWGKWNFTNNAWRRQIIDWWDKWWKLNKDKHPLFDSALDKRTRHEVCLINNLISERLKPRFSQLHSYGEAKEQALGSCLDYPIYILDYYPGLWNSMRADIRFPSDLEWLRDDPKVRVIIHARFGMRDLRHPEDRTKAVPDDFNSPHDDYWRKDLGKQLPVKTVFAKRLNGTDIVIEVKLATQDRKLASAMRTTLKELCSPEDEVVFGENNFLTSPLMLVLYSLGFCAVVVVVVVKRIRKQQRIQP